MVCPVPRFRLSPFFFCGLLFSRISLLKFSCPICLHFRLPPLPRLSVSRITQLQQKNPGITGDDMTSINTNLRRINEGLANLNDCARLRKWNKILMIAVTVLFVISAGTIYWVVSLRSERNELVKVEWLYRYVRPSIRNPNTIADIESRMFDGSDAQRDSIKSDAFTREVNGLPFRSFTLHDDWKPEPPEQEKAKTESEEEDSGGWFDWITRKTPQEEAALRDVRNNPNIPEGAKP